MPAVYDNLGIRFQYPENWRLDEEVTDDGRNAVSVYSPSGAFWSIVVHPRYMKPADLVKAAVAAMRDEYAELDVEETFDSIGGRRLDGCDLNFFYLDLTSTARIRAFRTRQASYLVLCQAEDREFERIREVFRAMTTSLFGP